MISSMPGGTLPRIVRRRSSTSSRRASGTCARYRSGVATYAAMDQGSQLAVGEGRMASERAGRLDVEVDVAEPPGQLPGLGVDDGGAQTTQPCGRPVALVDGVDGGGG